ncbi:MAG: EAL domain-containing protein [Lachnospiraceae bacterium]|nr:EAL domain-containing protein [Lachnospiraceae bacterium]
MPEKYDTLLNGQGRGSQWELNGMNIELQCCALFILSVVSVMFFCNKKLDLVNRMLFVRALTVCFLCLVFDIVSVAAIYRTVHYGFSETATLILCKIYIMLLVSQGFISFNYAAISILPRVRGSKILMKVYFGIYILGEIAMAVLPIDFLMDGRVVYSKGASTNVAYLLAGIYTVTTIVICLACRKMVSPRRFLSIFLWQAIWMLAAVIQFIAPGILLIGFASAFGMVVLYIQLENPSEYVDNETGAFNTNALSLYIKDRFRYERQFAFFTAKINYISDSVDYNMERNAVLRTVKGMSDLGPEPVFRLSDSMFGVLYENEDRMRERMMHLKKRKDAVTDVPAKGTYMLIPDSSKLQGPDEFFKFLHTYENEQQEITIADEELLQRMRNQNAVRDMIDLALKEDRVEVYYQPIYNAGKQRFTAAEALVRIRSKSGGIVLPGEFIPTAEENGQIIALGLRVFEKVCRFLAEGTAQSLGLERIEVNISAAQFDNENPAKFVIENITKYGIDPKMINLEITETAVNKNRILIQTNMEKLIEKGIGFSLDDFGTGQSNLDYFVNMPVENIKFDYKFTQAYFKNEKLKHVLAGMAEIMHNMDIKIVSEGVESEEQLKAMLEIRVEYIQGFHFSKPVPEEEFLAFLREKNRI